MPKSTIKKVPTEPSNVHAFAGILKNALVAVDPNSDVAIGTKVGQVLVWFEGKTYDIVVSERSG